MCNTDALRACLFPSFAYHCRDDELLDELFDELLDELLDELFDEKCILVIIMCTDLLDMFGASCFKGLVSKGCRNMFQTRPKHVPNTCLGCVMMTPHKGRVSWSPNTSLRRTKRLPNTSLTCT